MSWFWTVNICIHTVCFIHRVIHYIIMRLQKEKRKCKSIAYSIREKEIYLTKQYLDWSLNCISFQYADLFMVFYQNIAIDRLVNGCFWCSRLCDVQGRKWYGFLLLWYFSSVKTRRRWSLKVQDILETWWIHQGCIQ